MRRPLNYRCHMESRLLIPVVCLHTFYVAVLIGFTWTIRHIEFRFDEVKDLLKGILVLTSSIGTFSLLLYKAA
uniref:Uncharacterized protein n=1 Tax=Rhizophora mucronata TaxID=61149 RepID=A0A2P2JVA7_RHIMU